MTDIPKELKREPILNKAAGFFAVSALVAAVYGYHTESLPIRGAAVGLASIAAVLALYHKKNDLYDGRGQDRVDR